MLEKNYVYYHVYPLYWHIPEFSFRNNRNTGTKKSEGKKINMLKEEIGKGACSQVLK